MKDYRTIKRRKDQIFMIRGKPVEYREYNEAEMNLLMEYIETTEKDTRNGIQELVIKLAQARGDGYLRKVSSTYVQVRKVREKVREKEEERVKDEIYQQYLSREQEELQKKSCSIFESAECLAGSCNEMKKFLEIAGLMYDFVVKLKDSRDFLEKIDALKKDDEKLRQENQCFK